MNLKTLEIVSILEYRLREFITKAQDLRPDETAKAPEVAQRILEAAQALVERIKNGL